MIASPCRSLCQMDPVSKLCRGCLRTIDEIAAWSQLNDAARSKILTDIAERQLEYPSLATEADNNLQQNG